jgi:hypothetical protein
MERVGKRKQKTVKMEDETKGMGKDEKILYIRRRSFC